MPPSRPRAELQEKHARANKVAARRADAAVARLAEAEKGVLSLEELRACGLTRGAVAHRARHGRLHRLHQGVYAVGHRALTREAHWLAAVKACGTSAALSHFAAASFWGLVEWDDRGPDVTVPTRSVPRRVGIRVHQSGTLGREDVIVRDGIRVTTPGRTLVDVASQLSHHQLRRAVREGMARRRVSVRSLAEVLARLGPRRGSRKLVHILADGYAPTESVLEDVVLDLILAGAFKRPDIGRPIVIAGRRIVPDFRWPDQRLIVEADGRKWHDTKIAREDDAERQAFLEAHGERVLRVTWDEALTKQSQTHARLAAAGAPPERRRARKAR